MIISWLINLLIILVTSLNPISAWTGPTNLFTLDFAYENIEAEKAVVIEAQGRFLLYAKDADKPQAIASITKLMTALVFLETEPNLDELYRIQASDRVPGGKAHLFPGDELTLHDLLYTSLIASDNDATMALVSASNLDFDQFVEAMNEKARVLRLVNTHFVEVTGLDKDNVSTAREVAIITKEALSVPEIRNALEKKEYIYQTTGGREKVIESTDELLFVPENENYRLVGGKTGFINESGYCFTALYETKTGEQLIATVLGSLAIKNRFLDSQTIVQEVIERYLSDTIID